MKRLSLSLGALLLGALCSHSALASTFTFSFTGSAFSGSGTLIGTDDGVGEYNITSASGTITSVLGSSSISGVAGSTNELYFPGYTSCSVLQGCVGPTYLDDAGITFKIGSGTVNISRNGDSFWGYYYDGDYNPSAPFVPDTNEVISFTVSDPPAGVPEPNSLALLGTGILGAAGMFRRRLGF